MKEWDSRALIIRIIGYWMTLHDRTEWERERERKREVEVVFTVLKLASLQDRFDLHTSAIFIQVTPTWFLLLEPTAAIKSKLKGILVSVENATVYLLCGMLVGKKIF